MNQKPIAILGGGHGGHMMAVDLTHRGHEVRLYEHPAFRDTFQTTLERSAIEAVGYEPKGLIPIQCATTDMAVALEEAAWVHLVVPAIAHETFFDEMLPHLRSGQRVVVWAGDFGSLRLRQRLIEMGNTVDVAILETNTLPYGTRLVEPGRVELVCEAVRVEAASLPASRSAELIPELRSMFPCVTLCDHVLAAAFDNPNPMVHPPGSLLNTGRIQHSKGEFYMYREGITEAVARVIRAIYIESQAVARALGFSLRRYHDADFMTTASIFPVDFTAPFDVLGLIETFKGPTSVHNRYITEDLPYGLVPRSELGRCVDVPTPIIDAMIAIGSVVCRRDFREEGRTLASLGLENASPEMIRDM